MITMTMIVCACVRACVRVCVGREQGRARERLQRATQRMQQLHNDYVLAVRAAAAAQQQHYGRLQPSLMGGLHGLQHEMVLIL